jgi:hypothetical protein
MKGGGKRGWLVGADANRLYANEVTLSSIEQVPIAGGELVQIPVPVPGGGEEGKPERAIHFVAGRWSRHTCRRSTCLCCRVSTL